MNRDRVIGLLEELEAIETLEYHNKNHLHFGTSPKKLNKDKRSIIKAALVELNDIGDRPEK